MASKDDLGREGEEIATRFLVRAGYQITDRNWRGTRGEVDIVADDDGTVVIVEVKTRSSHAFGHPFDAITGRKLARLRRLAGEWCARAGASARGIRIDVVAVTCPPGAPAQIEHLKGVA